MVQGAREHSPRATLRNADIGHNARMADRILVVEDDPTIARVVTTALRSAGFEPAAASRGDDALAMAQGHAFDLVVLDLTLPGLDGLDVCRRIRETSEVPIIILSARGEEVDRILGLEIGADDYVTKPFSPRELVARVRSNLRRVELNAAQPVGPIAAGPLHLDLEARTATLRGRPLDLTYMQFELLALLAASPRRAFTREELSDHLTGGVSDGDPRSVDAHVRQLRRHLEPDPANPVVIRAVRGVGYAFDAPDDW